MSRGVLVVAVGLLAACTHGPGFLRSADSRADDLYRKALSNLDAANKQGSLDSAMAQLEVYLATGDGNHRREAIVLRQLARDAKQLARVEQTLAQAKTDTTNSRPATDAEAKRRDEEAVKEIQRLKDELAKANEELERIRKRLATPKPPTSH